MSTSPERILSAHGTFLRATTTLSDGEAMVHDWYVLAGEPEILLRTADATDAEALIPGLTVYLDDAAAWHRRATDAVVRRFSEGIPSATELDDAARSLVPATVEAETSGDILIHLDDAGGEHFPEGYWPAVRFNAVGEISDVTVES